MFVSPFITGMVVDALWDFIDLFRRKNLKNRLLIGLEDMVFCLLAEGAVLYMLYSSQVGQMRAYLIVALLAGVLWKKELKIIFKKATIMIKDHRMFKEGQ